MEMARIADALRTSVTVHRVETNLKIGTIVVHHEEQALDSIKAELKDLGVILMGATGIETSAKSITDAVSDLDRHLGSATGGILSLRLLAPVAFGALAALQLARRGLEIGAAPWYLLAYFAFESYVRLNVAEQKCEPAESAAGQ
jgi:hypothetical protein